MEFLAHCILIVIGLIICFGGIYIRKVVSGMIGFIWGLTAGIALVMLLAGDALMSALIFGSSDSDSMLYTILVLVIAAAITYISIKFERLCAAINAFFASFILLLIVLVLTSSDIGTLLVILALLGAAIIAYISYLYYMYAFVIVTAFSGGLLASIGIDGMVYNSNIVSIIMGYSDGTMLIFLCTIALGCAGTIFQVKKLHEMIGEQYGKTAQNNLNFHMNMEAVGKNITFSVDWDSVKKELQDEIILFAAPIIAFILFPIIWNTSTGASMIVYDILLITESVVTGIFIGGLVYTAVNHSIPFNAMYILPYCVSELIFYHSSFQYDVYSSFIELFKFVLLWCILYFASKIITDNGFRPILLVVIAIVWENWLCTLVIYLNTYSLLGLNVFNISKIITIVIVAWYLYQTRLCQNIFLLDSGTYSVPKTLDTAKRNQYFLLTVVVLLVTITISTVVVTIENESYENDYYEEQVEDNTYQNNIYEEDDLDGSDDVDSTYNSDTDNLTKLESVLDFSTYVVYDIRDETGLDMSGCEDFYFSYPADFLQIVEKELPGDGIWMKLEDDDNFVSVEARCFYQGDGDPQSNFQSAVSYIESSIVEKERILYNENASDGFARAIVTGYTRNKSQIVYAIIAVDDISEKEMIIYTDNNKQYSSYFEYMTECMYRACGFSNSSKKVEDKSLEENSTVQDNGVEQYVSEIRNICEQTDKELSSMTIEDGGSGTTRYIDTDGKIRMIITEAGAYYDLDSSIQNSEAVYFYDTLGPSEKVCFVSVTSENGDVYKFYLKDSLCYRYIDGDGEIYDYPSGIAPTELSAYAEFCSRASLEIAWAR